MLPLGIQEGSIVFHNPDHLHGTLNVNASVGVYNPSKGTCYYGTIWCDGYTRLIVPASASIPLDGSLLIESQGQYSDGSTPGVYSSWSSSNGSVASVADDGMDGDVSAGAVGSATITAQAALPLYGEYSGYNPTCAALQTVQTFSGSTAASVPCPTPAGEVSSPWPTNPWCHTCEGGLFTANLIDPGPQSPPSGKYKGRVVTEQFSDENDGCWYADSKYESMSLPTPKTPWSVSFSNSIEDGIADDPAWIAYYQGIIQSGAHKYAGNSCSQTEYQMMFIQACSGSGITQYEKHTTGVTVTATTVTAIRGGASVSGN